MSVFEILITITGVLAVITFVGFIVVYVWGHSFPYSKTAREFADIRYARGEISREEYLQLREKYDGRTSPIY